MGAGTPTFLILSLYFIGKYQLEDDFLQEINLMKRIGRHKHIVSMLACITRSQPLCLIVEYCCHGDLLNYIRRGRHSVSRIKQAFYFINMLVYSDI